MTRLNLKTTIGLPLVFVRSCKLNRLTSALRQAFLLLVLVSSLPTVSVAETKPNFIILFTDDQGYQDLGCYGSPDIKTPRIDQMAAEGIRFTDFYAQPVCGPSRKAILTGCYPLRTACASPKDRAQPHPRLELSEITLAEILKSEGYATAAYGKWDLDGRFKFQSKSHLPTHQGFDYYYGAPDNGAKLFLENDQPTKVLSAADRTRGYTDKAISFIETNHDRPFFVYLSYHMPHVQLAVSKDFKGKSKGGLYGDVIEEIDFNVGRVLDTLVEQGLEKNTYVLFASDNGPWYLGNSPPHVKRYGGSQKAEQQGGSALPLRGDKTTSWEGGFRVPGILWAPERIPAARTYTKIATTLDVLPTFTKLAGGTLPTDRVIDGHDISHILHGDTEADSPTEVFYYYVRNTLQAVRSGKWKLRVPHAPDAVWERFYRDGDFLKVTSPMLYDLEVDLGETKDLAAEHPEVVARLLKHVQSARQDIGDGEHIGAGAR